MKITLRKFNKNDLETYSQWRKETNAEIFMSRWFPKKFNEKLIEQPMLYNFFIISCSGLDIGAIWIEKEENINGTGKLGILIGNKNYWNKGIGKIAIEKAIELSKENLNLNTILLNVRKNNPRAISCYLKCGFNRIAEGKKIINKIKIEYLIMIKEI